MIGALARAAGATWLRIAPRRTAGAAWPAGGWRALADEGPKRQRRGRAQTWYDEQVSLGVAETAMADGRMQSDSCDDVARHDGLIQQVERTNSCDEVRRAPPPPPPPPATVARAKNAATRAHHANRPRSCPRSSPRTSA